MPPKLAVKDLEVRVRGNAHASTRMLAGHERHRYAGVESLVKELSSVVDSMAAVLHPVCWGPRKEISTTGPRSYCIYDCYHKG